MKKTSFLILALLIGVFFASPVFHSEAAIDGHLRITSPNGGENYTEGDTVTITWDASSNIDKVYIGYSTGPGSLNWIKTNVPNTGSYTWKVDVGNTTRTQFLVDITGYETGKGSLTDKSDGYFTVNQSGGTPAPAPTPTPTPTPTPIPAAPTITFSADQSSVAFGGATTLRWSSTNTNSCQASDAWAGAKSTNGSQSTGSLTANRSFTLTCSGPGGSISHTLYVSVAAQTSAPTGGKGSTTAAPVSPTAASTPLTVSHVTIASFFYWEGSRTTVLSDIDDPTRVEEFTLDVFGAGYVMWAETIDISSQEALAALDNVEEYVTITSWFFYIEWEFWAIWEVPVEVTLHNPEVVAEPVIYKDGNPADVGEVKVVPNEKGGSDIKFTATGGGKYEVKHAITLDEQNPKVSSRNETYTLSGYVSDPTAQVTVTVNGEALSEKITPDPKTGRFERAITLIFGNNSIALAAESPNGAIDPVTLNVSHTEGRNPWLYILGAIILLLGIAYGWFRMRKNV